MTLFLAVIPHWTGHVYKLDKRGDKGSPLLLFISSAATRVVELNRSVINFNLFLLSISRLLEKPVFSVAVY